MTSDTEKKANAIDARIHITQGFLLGISIMGTAMMTYIGSFNSIPKTDNVQSGFVVPSKLEILLEDNDHNGEDETIMQYDGKKYLLTVDDQGKPKVQTYQVKPAEIISKEY